MSTTASAITPPADFPDWFSPMIVKEIRQGLRGWLFISLFSLLHCGLLFWCFLQSQNRRSTSEGDGFFWGILVTGLVIIVSRGINALHAERHGNTLELLKLSRLSAWRIMLGKWTALVVQMALFLSSLLPYGILRYYTGSFNASNDTRVLIFIASLALIYSALTVYLSCLPRWIGWGCWGSFLFLTIIAISGINSSTNIAEWSVAIAFLASSAVYVPVLLALGAVTFASASENLSTGLRMLMWASLLPGVAFLLLDAKNDISFFALVLSLPIILLVVTNALTAPSAETPFALRNFRKFRFSGKLAALIFAPNRASGMFYTLISGVAFLIIVLNIPDAKPNRPEIATFVAASGAFVFLAAACVKLLPRKWNANYTRNIWIFYMVFIGISAVVLMIGNNMPRPERHLWEKGAMATPVGVIMSLLNEKNFPAAVTATCIHWGVAFAILLLPMIREIRTLRRLLSTQSTPPRP